MASLLCGIAVDPGFLVAARAAQLVFGLMLGVFLLTLVDRHQRRVPQAGTILIALSLTGYQLLISSQGTQLPFGAAAAPMLPIGLGLGAIGAQLSGLTLSRVHNEDAGSAAGLFNTAMQSGTTLGLAMASFVFFNHAPAGSHGTTVTTAFAGSIWYVITA
ncbi:hypothetical protein [Streptomyces venezuelae]